MAMKMFTSSRRTSLASLELTGEAKLKDVTKLMDKLTSDLQQVDLSPNQRDDILEKVKVYGRDPTNSDPIFTKEGIETLARHAFNSSSPTTSRNASRCLANALLLRENTRQIFVDLGYEEKACNKLKNDSIDDEFLVSRIIFLTTYGTNIDIEKLIDDHHLADNICSNLSRHAEIAATKQKKTKDLDPMTDMALGETLKLMFNISHFCPQRISAFSPALQHLTTILTKRALPKNKPLEPPVGPIINALLNIELENKDNKAIVFPEDTPTVTVDRLIEILDKTIRAYEDDELEKNITPLLTLMRKVYEIAPKDVQVRLQKAILPSKQDRKEILGRGTTLPSRLLQLSSNSTSPQLRDSISSFLFELSGKDAKSFIQNVGYGFASGFLFGHNIAIPENAMEAWSTSDSDSTHARASQDSLNGKINPITGQFLENEAKVEMPTMTEEEKEREAERLFVLFERLKKTGVMNVQNPVEKAFHEGRFEELDDDAESD